VNTHAPAAFDVANATGRQQFPIFLKEIQRCIRSMTRMSLVITTPKIGKERHERVMGSFARMGEMSN
jgi:hypothetical protein